MKLELHIHSTFSLDSMVRPVEIVKIAKSRGIKALAITDHNEIGGALEAKKLAGDLGVEIIIGEELATDNGDIIGLFLKEKIIERDALIAIDKIHAQGGIAVLPHPFRSHDLTDEIVEKVDAIEVYNARNREELNQQAIELAQKHHKPMIAGSDAHFAEEIGRAVTIIKTEDIRQAILSGQADFEVELTPRSRTMQTLVVYFWKTARYWKIPGMLYKSFRQYLKEKK